jgi:cell wall-associated NlpC family hydrolase
MTAVNGHWAARYIGLPWTPAFTCWHFCARVWRDRFGVAVPLVEIDGRDARAARRAFEAEAGRQGWLEVTDPREGDAVLMAKGARPCHVGIWLALGGVLHCIEGNGAIYSPRHRLGDLGYRVVGFWRRAA